MREEKRGSEAGDTGPTEGARVGGMEVGVIGKEERQPTDQNEGASPAACGCHPRQERKKRSLQLTCPACGQMQADLGRVKKCIWVALTMKETSFEVGISRVSQNNLF